MEQPVNVAGLAEPVAGQPRTVEKLAWVCGECNRECVPIRSESRCLCGHRFKEHAGNLAGKCEKPGCKCRSFFFIVAEGSWILRCRCKHKHIEHRPEDHTCAKPKCDCKKFDSPWVCNCDHPWAAHSQVVKLQQVKSLPGIGDVDIALLGAAEVAALGCEVNRWDLIDRGKEGESGGDV